MTCLVDAHVHVHACFNPAAFWDGAVENFRVAARALGLPALTPGWLLLTETATDDYFRRLRSGAITLGAGWRVEPTEDASALHVRRAGAPPIVLVAGRQVATREGLEVLALATDAAFTDRQPFGAALAAVRASGAIAVLPWGFGKWWLGRGRLIDDCLRARGDELLFVGDNGGRPAIGPEPRAFAVAAAQGRWCLPGSDPLPLPAHQARAGSYGCVLESLSDDGRPAEALRRALRALPRQPATYGRREGLVRFCRNQVLMQWHKRLRAGAGRRVAAFA